MTNKLKTSKNLAWIAFVIYIVSLFLPYGRFNVHGGTIFTGIKLKLFVLLGITIPLLILFFIRHSKKNKIIVLLLISLLGIGGFWLLFEYILFSSAYPIKLGIGIYLYFLMTALFLIASIIKFQIPEKKMYLVNEELIDQNTW